MKLPGALLVAFGPTLVVACPNPASAPVPTARLPRAEGDRPETASARRLERLLVEERRGRLARPDRAWLAATLRKRAAEWEALGAPAAASADLRRAQGLSGVDVAPTERALVARVHRALGDRALGRGDDRAARRHYQRAVPGQAAAPAGWRRAALEPKGAALSELGRAVEQLSRHAPERSSQLLESYLGRRGGDPEVLLAGLRAARERPDPALARRAFDALVSRHGAAFARRACALFGRDDQAPTCLRLPPDRPPSGPLGAAPTSPGASRAAGPGAASVPDVRAFRIVGERLVRWGFEAPPGRMAWPTRLPPGMSADRALALVARGADEARRAADPAFEAVAWAARGRLAEAVRHARQAPPPEGLRLLARLQALAGQRRAAARTLLELRWHSPGGATWQLASLQDLGVLGLGRAALEQAGPLVEAGVEDPVVLRVLVALFVAVGAGEQAVLQAERWASLSGDPASAYRFAIRLFAEAGDAPRTARFAARLLEWIGGRPGPTRRAVVRALRAVGRTAEAARVENALGRRAEPQHPAESAPPPAKRASAAAPGSASGSLDAELFRLAVGTAMASPRRAALLTYCAALSAERAGQGARARRIFAEGWRRDPDRFAASGWRRLGLAARGRPLSALLRWDTMQPQWECPGVR